VTSRAQRLQRDGEQLRRDADRSLLRDQQQSRERDTIGRNIERDRDRQMDDAARARRDRDFADRAARDRDRDFGDRDARDRDFADRDGRGRDRDFDRDDGRSRYWQWRNDAWAGERGRGRDFRDWSGRWRDGDRFDVARSIRNNWRDRDWNDFPFRAGWWGGGNWHGHHWHHWNDFARTSPWYWWAWATAPRLTNWFVYDWSTPYYWDYGPGEYIYYNDGAIYVNGRWHQPAPVFYDNTVRIVEQAPDWTAEEAAAQEWLPLGVFAVTREGMAEVDVLVQLAVTQDGVLGGSATDQQSGVVYSVEGAVDNQSQRAVWAYTDERGERVVMETSIFNLTQPEATGLIQLGPNNIEVIELVRLEAPERTSVAVEGELPAPPAAR
jgi:hypothetical protein